LADDRQPLLVAVRVGRVVSRDIVDRPSQRSQLDERATPVGRRCP
jgi:hypothetical protein